MLLVEDLPTSRAPRVSALGGMELVTVTAAVQQERGLSRARGALIVSIGDDTRAATGLQVGDVIVQVNRVSIETGEDVRRALRASAGGAAVRGFFERNQQLGYSEL